MIVTMNFEHPASDESFDLVKTTVKALILRSYVYQLW